MLANNQIWLFSKMVDVLITVFGILSVVGCLFVFLIHDDEQYYNGLSIKRSELCNVRNINELIPCRIINPCEIHFTQQQQKNTQQ